MGKTAVILGATGLTGGHLLDLILVNEAYDKVIVLTRRATGKKHSKMEEYIVDMLHLSSHKAIIRGDVLFCCIGTTKAKTPDRELYRQIDYGIPVNVAKIAVANNIPQIQIISAPGAKASSRVFYTKIKGEMQDAVQAIVGDKSRLYFLQPSLIVGKRAEKRSMENIADGLMTVFNPFIPLNYKKIEGKTIAKAMLAVAKNEFPSSIVSSKELQILGGEG